MSRAACFDRKGFELACVAAVLRLVLSSRKGNSVLLLGPSGSGKTTLFYQLRDGNIHNGTVASMQENAGTFAFASEKVFSETQNFAIKAATCLTGPVSLFDFPSMQAQQAKPVHLIDVPGHPKVRNQFQGYLNNARGIVFVIDSVDFMGQKTTVAE